MSQRLCTCKWTDIENVYAVLSNKYTIKIKLKKIYFHECII